MKSFAILSAVATAVLALNISTASSQGACQQEYTGCLDSCVTRSSKTLQDSCFNSCEGRNNMCAERVYGKRPFNGASSNTAQQSTAKEALAKEPLAKEPLAKEPVAAPQAAEPAPQPEPAPAAQPRR